MVRPRREISLETTPLQNQIYVLLVNPNNPRFPRTQHDVVNLLNLSKSTVNDNVKRLIEKEFIAERERVGKEIFYRPGKYKKLIERRIPIDNIAYGAQFDTYGQAITVPSYAELRQERTMQPYIPAVRTHLNGGWLMITVIREGNLDYIPADPAGETKDGDGNIVRWPLFGEKNPWNLRGSVNWNAVLEFGNSMLDIRYQRTSGGKKYFYIVPDNNVCTAADTTPDDDVVSPFMASITPVLDWMEEHGDWRFLRDDQDEYDCVANLKEGKKGLRKEYGLDDFMSQIFAEYLGENFGIPGVTPAWIDKSPSAMGSNGEMEFARQDYVHAVEAMPETMRKAAGSADRKETIRLITELRSDLNAAIGVILERLDILLPLEYKTAKKTEVPA